MSFRFVALAIVAAAVMVGGTAHAHGPSEIFIGSTADGGGALEADYDFDTVAPLTFVAEIAGTSIYTSDEPSLDALATDDVANGHYVLDDGTEVRVEVTGGDLGTTALKVNGTVLDAVGESAVIATFSAADPAAFHRHPEWQLVLALPAGVYGSGTISFKLTTTSPSYTSSASYALTLSNGHLAPFDFDPAQYDKAAIDCQKTIGKAVRGFVAAAHQNLAKCLDKAQIVEAIEAAGSNASKAAAQAAGACGDALVEKIAAARHKAVDAIGGKCTAVGLGAEAIAAHVSYAGCQTEELLGASYPGAHHLLETYTAGGQPTSDQFPCL